MHVRNVTTLLVMIISLFVAACGRHDPALHGNRGEVGTVKVENTALSEKEKTDTDQQLHYAAHSFFKAQIPFVKNQGQIDPQVDYYAQTSGGTVFVRNDGSLVYSLPTPDRGGENKSKSAKNVVFTERLVRAQVRSSQPVGRSKTNVSLFRGSSPGNWMTDLPSYDSISYSSVYPGITFQLIAHNDNVEKVFLIEPGADPSQIEIELSMVKVVKVTPEGLLSVETAGGEIVFSRPNAWQENNTVRKPVEVMYAVNNEQAGHYGFRLGEYDQNLPLWIDPLLQSTYLGGSSFESAYDMAIGPNGDVYVVGTTSSSDFPVCLPNNGFCIAGADDEFILEEPFVARMSQDLTHLLQTTYLGGTGGTEDGEEEGKAIAIDGAGNVYIAGHTSSDDFPGRLGGADPYVSGIDGFVAKLSADLRTLYQSSLVGGSGHDEVAGVAVSDGGDVFVVGYTESADLPVCMPTTGPNACFPLGRPDDLFFGDSEAFVAKFDSDLQVMITSTYLGGNNSEEPFDLAIANNGDVYVVGYTDSSNFPFVYAGYDSEISGRDVFVSHFNNTLTIINESTFYGGSGQDVGKSIALSPADGTVYIAGYTSSQDLLDCSGLICTEPADDEIMGGEGFVARFSPDLSSLNSATYLGGSDSEALFDLAVVQDPNNSYGSLVYVAGQTYSTDFPGRFHGDASFNKGERDGFIVKLNSTLETIEQAAYLGGSSFDLVSAIAIHDNGDIYAAGTTSSPDIPRTSGGCDTTRQLTESFVSRFSSLKRDVKYYVIPLQNGKAVQFGL